MNVREDTAVNKPLLHVFVCMCVCEQCDSSVCANVCSKVAGLLISTGFTVVQYKKGEGSDPISAV